MDGHDITWVEPPKREMGVVFQNYALFPHKTIYDNVAFGLRMRKVVRDEIRERVANVLKTVGLTNVENRLPSQLSGGQRQRVAVARAIVIEPRILLLDEPLSNLDAVLRKRMRLELRDIQKRLGIATIFVTHDQDEAFEMSDRIVLMNQGRIEQIGSPEALYDEPVTRFCAEFIGETNLLSAIVIKVSGDRATLNIGNGTTVEAHAEPGRLRVGGGAYLMVRPERIDLSLTQPKGSSLQADIVKRVFSGDKIIFTLVTDQGLELVCQKPSTALFRGFVPGIRAWANPEDCQALPRDA